MKNVSKYNHVGALWRIWDFHIQEKRGQVLKCQLLTGEKRGQVLKCQLLIANDTRIFFHSHGRCSISTPDPLGFFYFGVVGNLAGLYAVRQHVMKLLHKWLNRRSGRKSFTWERLKHYLTFNPLPTPRCCGKKVLIKVWW